MPELMGNVVLRVQPAARMSVDRVLEGNTTIRFQPDAQMIYAPAPSSKNLPRRALTFLAKEALRAAIREAVGPWIKDGLERLREMLFAMRARRTRVTAPAS